MKPHEFPRHSLNRWMRSRVARALRCLDRLDSKHGAVIVYTVDGLITMKADRIPPLGVHRNRLFALLVTGNPRVTLPLPKPVPARNLHPCAN